jgi:hypothetical protein
LKYIGVKKEVKQYIIDEKKLMELLMKSYLFDSIADSNSNINIKGYALRKMTDKILKEEDEYEAITKLTKLP